MRKFVNLNFYLSKCEVLDFFLEQNARNVNVKTVQQRKSLNFDIIRSTPQKKQTVIDTSNEIDSEFECGK